MILDPELQHALECFQSNHWPIVSTEIATCYLMKRSNSFQLWLINHLAWFALNLLFLSHSQCPVLLMEFLRWFGCARSYLRWRKSHVMSLESSFFVALTSSCYLPAMLTSNLILRKQVSLGDYKFCARIFVGRARHLLWRYSRLMCHESSILVAFTSSSP